MKGAWKAWLAAGAALLLMGAGCAADVQTGASVQPGAEQGASEQPPAGEQGTGSETGLSADVDATVDAILGDVDADSSASMEESDDADVVGNDSAELNAYGQAYDQSQL